MCMHVLLACIFVCHMHAWYLQRPEEAVGTGVTESYELPRGCYIE